jgi:hypothetical protein
MCHGRVPSWLVVVEGEAEFGELAFQFLALGIEGRVDAGFGESMKGGGETERAFAREMIEPVHDLIPFRVGGHDGPPG